MPKGEAGMGYEEDSFEIIGDGLKIFTRGHYKKFDHKGKIAGRWLFWKLGHELLPDRGEEYKKGDFWVRKNGETFMVEAEYAERWQDKYQWPSNYPTVHCPYRKRDSESRYFFVVNHHCTMGLTVDMEVVLSSKVQTIPRTTYSINEDFFDVPLEKVTFYIFSEMEKPGYRKELPS